MTENPGAVDLAYRQLRDMAARYEFKPGARLNESLLANTLSTSRTPLREALNRLTAEGYLTFRRGQGFFCRSLTPDEVMDLYEARAAIECEAVRLAALRADPHAIAQAEAELTSSIAAYTPGTPPAELVRLDEAFHLRLAALSGNAELVRLLGNINGRIHFVRLIDLQAMSARKGHGSVTITPHQNLLAAVKAGQATRAAREMRKHIERRRDQVAQIVRTAFSRLYAP